MELKIRLEFTSPDAAERILDAVSPDNEPLPPGLIIDSRQVDDSLQFWIDCTRSIDSLRHTFEDLMGAVDLSLRTTEQLNSRNP